MSSLLDQIKLDKAAFFDAESGFAIVGQIDEVDVDLIFDADYVDAPAGIATMESAGPAVHCWAEDAPETLGHASIITVAGEDYKVKSIRPDGTGELIVMLQGPV